MFQICKYYPNYNNNHYQEKRQCELISLITEPILLDRQEQISNESIKTMQEDIESEMSNAQVCRICYSTGDLQSLINPCECSGTMGILHRNCLERWLEISNTSKCEICQHEFEVIRYPRSLFYFLKNPLRSSDIRYLINDLILFIFLTTIISWLSIVNLTKLRTADSLFDAISYIILPICVFFIYILWCWVSFRYHIEVIREWRCANQLTRVIHKKSPAHSHVLINTLNEEHVFPHVHTLE